MITNEIYKDRTALNEEQQIKHLNLLKDMLNEYLAVYTKASHSKTFANKMNDQMDSYIKTKDLNIGLSICMELLKYDPNDETKQKNIHIVISRIVYNAIKEVEINMDQHLCDAIYKLLLKIDDDYKEQYKDCYSKLANVYKTEGEYSSAVELYTILANIEMRKPTRTTVPASYLLTYCYVKKNINCLSIYDMDTTIDTLTDYTNLGGVDYLNVQETVENLRTKLSANTQTNNYSQQYKPSSLNS